MANLPPALRVPMLLLGMLALVSGVLGGLARLGWGIPVPLGAGAAWHGALMISAFFGTVISLERAVALGRAWAYLAPLMAGAGGVALLAGGSFALATTLLTAASAVLVAASISVMRRQVAAFTVVIALGAACWLLGNAMWLLTGNGPGVVPAWLGFLILTIAGERLELTRFLPTPAEAKKAFLAIVAALLLGMLTSAWRETPGLALFSAGLFALAIWLLRYDIARRNIRAAGMTRFIATCLLSGYVWLAAGACLGLAGALGAGHPWRDPALHALTLGFVFSMVIGHALIVFPAIVRIRIPFHPVMYGPLVALHLSLAVRVAAGFGGSLAGMQYGALANALSMALFIVVMAGCALKSATTRAVEASPQGGR